MRDNYNHSPTSHTKAQKPHATNPTCRPWLNQDRILERHPISNQRLKPPLKDSILIPLMTMTADFASRKLRQPSVNETPQFKWCSSYFEGQHICLWSILKVCVGGCWGFSPFSFFSFLKVWTHLTSLKCIQMIHLRHSISPSDWQKKKASVFFPLTPLSHKSYFLA